MPKPKIYTNEDVAELCGCSVETVKKYAQKPQHGISFLNTKTRRFYVWFDEDMERFKTRNTARGRPKKTV